MLLKVDDVACNAKHISKKIVMFKSIKSSKIYLYQEKVI